MTEIVVEQRIAADPATVYEYLTEPAKWTQWQGVAADLDPRVGGVFSMVMGNGMNARGEFIELIPNQRVVFSWGWIDRPGIPPGSTIVSIELEPVVEGTLLVITHRAVHEDEAPMQLIGWRHYLPRLAVAASGGDPGPDPGPG